MPVGSSGKIKANLKKKNRMILYKKYSVQLI